MAEYVVLDINDRLLQGTAESRGEVLGEMLFAILLDVSIAKALKGVNGIPDDDAVAELSDIKFKDGFDGNHAEFKSRKPYHLGNESCTLTLRPANHEALTSMLRVFDNGKKSDFIKFLSKYGNNADDIIERLSSGNGLAAKAVNSHFDDFVSCYDKYKTDFVKVFSTYPKYSDDIIALTGKHNSAFLKAINDYPEFADDIFKYSKQRGDYFVTRVIDESTKGSKYLDDLLEKVSRKGAFNSSTLSTSNSFNIKAANLLEKYGYTVDDFNNLKLKNVSNYSADEIKFMKEFRESIEAPTNTTLMSKVLPYESIVDYTSGKYTTLGGFVTKADDVSMCNDYMDYYNMLRLDYIPAQYFPDSDDALAVIRFYTNETDKITVPYYKSESWGGTCDNDPPFTGNGFTASKNGTVIPEYWCYDNITDTMSF